MNRLPVLLLPGDTYATRRQGPVLQQLQHPVEADATVNDAFRPVSRFFDRINRPEQLLTALPHAMRVLTDPVDTGAVVLSLPQDVQSHAFDFPAEFFAERDWVIRRPDRRPRRGRGRRPAARQRRASRSSSPAAASSTPTPPPSSRPSPGSAGIPVLETMAGKGAVQQRAWWQIGGIGLEGTPVNNDLVREADFVLTVGSRLTDFPTASQSLFENPDVQFASINVNGYDAQRLGATGIVGDAKRALAALADEVAAAGYTTPQEWQDQVRSAVEGWEPVRAAALDPDTPFDRATIPADFPDIVPDTGALLTQGQVIGLHAGARPGRRHDRRRRRRPARGHAEGVGRDRGPVRPPGVRVLLHGLRDPGRDGRPARRPEPGLAGGGVHRRRHLPHVAHRAGHRRAGEHRRHRGDPGEPRLPGDPPPADGPPRHASSATSSATAPARST